MPLRSSSVVFLFLFVGGARADDHFESRVRPILVTKCMKCHSGTKAKGGLRLDSRAAMLRGGKRGAAIVPKSAQASLLIRAMRRRGKLKMPPGSPLPKRVISDFVKWIERGAPWPEKRASSSTSAATKGKHWAFQPIRHVHVPIAGRGWAANPVDRFVAAGHRQQNLTANPPATRRTLIRRVTFDLTGLPPTPAEVEQFIADPRPDAYVQLVDRLLGSPRYGERWARHWLDVARYADTAGDNGDYPIPQMYLYRDYVIDAFNGDKPYDQFVIEQLAGDQIANANRDRRRERIIATGFIALSRRFGTKAFQYRHLEIEDTIDTTGRSLLALTIRCARCHDHKFDPITNRDYYAMYGLFASTQYPFAGAEAFKGQLHMVSLKYTRAEHQRLVREADKQVTRLRQAAGKNPTDKSVQQQLAAATAARKELDQDLAYAVGDASPVDERIHQQGNPKTRGDVVLRNAPAFLTSKKLQIPSGTSGRLQFAHWVVNKQNPLTARVLVNRLWQHHFGAAIVSTPSNFGTAGSRPSHPRLLDWLARQFMDNGWSIKYVQRLIVLSSTYRQDSRANAANLRKDGGNRYLWRFARRQLDAESIRDGLLAVSGKLDLSRPVGHPFPPMKSWNFSQHRPFQATYPTRHRSVYMMTQRIQRHPFLTLFDGPNTNQSTGLRGASIVPQQALYLMNNPFVRSAAAGLAQRIAIGTSSPEQQVRKAVYLAWGRPATPAEVTHFRTYRQRYQRQLQLEKVPRHARENESRQSLARLLLTSNEFLYID